jgi:nitroreductase/dihydropteridine reductase
MAIAGEMATMPAPELRAWLDGQAYIALAYALLGARSLGLDCCPMTHFEADRYGEILDLPAGVSPVVLLAVGYAADEPRPKWRYPLTDLLL